MSDGLIEGMDDVGVRKDPAKRLLHALEGFGIPRTDQCCPSLTL